MSTHPIYLSNTLYQQLLKRAEQEHTSLEQIAEHLLDQSLTSQTPTIKNTEPQQQTISQALAAVHHLTTLFTDIEINSLEQALADPMLELANIDLELALL